MFGITMPFELQNLLKDWGLTLGILAVAATSCMVLFVFGTREFFAWYFRLNQLSKTQKSILEKLQTLESAVEAQNIFVRKLELVKPNSDKFLVQDASINNSVKIPTNFKLDI
jgi:hypothetical protein